MLLGVVCLLTGVAALVWRPDLLATYHYSQYVIAVTHLFTLGWVCSIVMGATYQLVPVALESTLHSERMARWHFVLHLAGVAGMVAMFWVWNMKQVGHFGSIFALGAILFIYNIGRTLARIPRWTVVALTIACALVWLLLTVTAGLFLAATKCWPIALFSSVAQMHAHAHLGGLGFFVMMTVGVSYKLIPMFTLSEVQSERRAWASIVLLNLGLAVVFPGILLESGWKFAGALVVVAGLIVYGVEMAAILRARQRQSLDWGLRYFLTAVGCLLPVSVLGLILAWPSLPLTVFTGQLENVYGFLALIGVITFAILGMLYKIVPFLVWYARYSREIGRSKVPALADLYSSRLQAWTYWLFVSGLVATSTSALMGHAEAVRWSCMLLAAGLLVFAINMAGILFHLFRPRIEPLPLAPSAARPAAA